MPPSSVKYLARTSDGQESGPYDLEELQALIAAGTLAHDCEVRNVILPRWKNAGEMPELKDAVTAAAARAEAADPEAARKKRLQGKGAAGAGPGGGLHLPGTFAYTPGSVGLRLAAGLTDALLVFLFGVMVGVAMTIAGGGEFSAGGALVGSLVWYTGALMYLAWSVGFTAQTLGQHFWGLMVVRAGDGKEVLLGRAFLFALATMLTGVLTPIAVLSHPGRRGFNDLISGTRVVRTRIVYEH